MEVRRHHKNVPLMCPVDNAETVKVSVVNKIVLNFLK